MKIMCLVADRKELVVAIENYTGQKMKYQGPPTFAYVNEAATVLRDGTLEIADLEESREMLLELSEKQLIDDSWNEDRDELNISLPTQGHTAKSLTNLVAIFFTKAEIINKAIGMPRAFEVDGDFAKSLVENEPQEISDFLNRWEEAGGTEVTRGLSFTEEEISFTGFPFTTDSDMVNAFLELTAAIGKLAKESKYIKLNPDPIENEKYSFRVWLVRIGFGGNEHKTSRKLLLKNLSGHTAFRTEEQKEQHKQKYLAKKAEASNEDA